MLLLLSSAKGEAQCRNVAIIPTLAKVTFSAQHPRKFPSSCNLLYFSVQALLRECLRKGYSLFFNVQLSSPPREGLSKCSLLLQGKTLFIQIFLRKRFTWEVEVQESDCLCYGGEGQLATVQANDFIQGFLDVEFSQEDEFLLKDPLVFQLVDWLV